jgi:pimeloyl-ACP methyl ester carboxylesterase
MIFRFTMMWLAAAAAFAQTADITGTWQGTLDAGAVRLRMGLHVSRNDAGEYRSTLDSIDQSAMGIPVAKTTVTGAKLHLDMPKMAATFDGTLSADGMEIAGAFAQGAAIPLVFKRVDKIETLIRPQNPKPPFPYLAEDVLYENTAAGVKLAGTLTIPRGTGPFPAALMITGSGPQDRDEALMGHQPFWIIADALARRGIAVLRVDDRGMGKSTGNSTRSTLDDFVSDVLVGVTYLKGRKEIDAKHIGVIGHSEGGVVGPAAAAKSGDIAFVVMLGGTGVDGVTLLYAQAAAIQRASGATDAMIAENREVQKMMFDIYRAEPDERAAAAKIWDDWQKRKASLPEAKRRQADAGDANMRAQIAQFNVPEMRSFMFYDPALALRKLKTPVLALNGSRDTQVPPEQNLPAISAALKAAGNPDFTVKELPGLNHLFQHCKKCTPAEYGELEETFAPEALEIMGDWILKHAH